MKKKVLLMPALLCLLSACAPGNGGHIHDLTYHNRVNPTCTEDGYQGYYTCDLCDKLFSDENAEHEITNPEVIQATGHGEHLHHVAAIQGTCLDIGYAEYYECYACDNLYSDAQGTQEIEAPVETGYGSHQLKHVAEQVGDCMRRGIAAHYECSLCEKLFTDSLGQNQTSLEALYTGSMASHQLTHIPVKAATNWTNGVKEHYHCSLCNNDFLDANGTQLANTSSLRLSNGAWVRKIEKKSTYNNSNVTAQYVNVTDEVFNTGTIKATEVSINGNLNSGATWDHPNNWDDSIALDDRVNNRMPHIPGETLHFKMYFKNTGSSAISLKYLAWNDSKNDNNNNYVNVTLQPGASKIVDHQYACGSDDNSGGWSRFTATSAISSGAKFVTYTYYSLTDNDYFEFNNEVDKDSAYIEKVINPNKTRFSVGETFSAAGLVLKLRTNLIGGPDGGNIMNYDTNYDGYTFKSSDVGTKTVTVTIADATYTYTITVA